MPIDKLCLNTCSLDLHTWWESVIFPDSDYQLGSAVQTPGLNNSVAGGSEYEQDSPIQQQNVTPLTEAYLARDRALQQTQQHHVSYLLIRPFQTQIPPNRLQLRRVVLCVCVCSLFMYDANKTMRLRLWESSQTSFTSINNDSVLKCSWPFTISLFRYRGSKTCYVLASTNG